MGSSHGGTVGRSAGHRPGLVLPFKFAIALVCALGAGCAALTNPTIQGIPPSNLPPELLGPSREGEKVIPMHLLRQPPPDAYRLGPGDVLGVWIEGILDERNFPQLPLVPVPERTRRFPERSEIPSGAGYPITVRPDGTLPLPQIPPIPVVGMTTEEALEAIRKAYTVDKKIIQPGRERIVVTLLHKRLHRVLVFRHDPPDINATLAVTRVGLFGSGAQLVGTVSTGTGFEIDLPAYENDLLHALALTGGFPGTNAAREIIIYRNGWGDGQQKPVVRIKGMHPTEPGVKVVEVDPGCLPPGVQGPDGLPPGEAAPGPGVIRIPLRLRPGEPLAFRPEDVVLQSGDVVFVQAAPVDTFYTGGLLPSAEHILPRDYDLDVIEAVTRVRGPLVNGAFGGNNLSGTLIQPGIGNPSPRLLSIIRRVPGHEPVVINVDLHRALLHLEERILVQPGDVLILQETPLQALARYFTDVFILEGFFRLLNRRDAMITTSFAVP